MEVILYTNRADNRVVSKESQLQQVADVEAQLKDGCSVVNPTLILTRSNLSSVSRANYMYIPAFERYYYISQSPVILTGGIIEISAHVDVLMSFGGAIRNIYGMIERQENLMNMDIPDSEIPALTGRDVAVKYLSSTPFTVSSGGNRYALITTGG